MWIQCQHWMTSYYLQCSGRAGFHSVNSLDPAHVITGLPITPLQYDPWWINIKNGNDRISQWLWIVSHSDYQWCALKWIVRFLKPFNICIHSTDVTTHVWKKLNHLAIPWLTINHTSDDGPTSCTSTNALPSRKHHIANVCFCMWYHSTSDGVRGTTIAFACKYARVRMHE